MWYAREMRWIGFFLSATLLAACAETPRTAVNPRADFGKINRVAVVAFQGPNGDLAADYLTQSLMSHGADVVERRQLAAVLAERKMTQSGMLDTSTIKQVGQILGVDALFVGTVAKSVDAQSYMVTGPAQPSRRGPHHAAGARATVTPVAGPVAPAQPVLGLPNTRIVTTEANVSIIARMVDARTGAVMWSGSMKEVDFSADDAIRTVADSLVDSLAPHWPALVPAKK